MQICQNYFCCQTPTLCGIYATGTTKIFSGSQLGECENAAINMNEPINVTFFTISTNGWKGTVATIHNNENIFYPCPITSWLDLGNTLWPDNFETTCTTIAGNHAGLLVGWI